MYLLIGLGLGVIFTLILCKSRSSRFYLWKAVQDYCLYNEDPNPFQMAITSGIMFILIVAAWPLFVPVTVLFFKYLKDEYGI